MTAWQRVPVFIRLIRQRRIEDGCWIYTGSVAAHGYGVLSVKNHAKYVHRVAYELFRGPIPDGLHLDHLCRRKACFNPDHLEPVTAQENILRGQAPCALTVRNKVCQRGHTMTPDNIYIRPDGTKRLCRQCIKIRSQRLAAKRRAAKLAGVSS